MRSSILYISHSVSVSLVNIHLANGEMVPIDWLLLSKGRQIDKNLKDNMGFSFHSMSDTRWSAGVDSVRHFAPHLPGIKTATDKRKGLNLTAQIRSDLQNIRNYISSFKIIVRASIWINVLTAIVFINKDLKATDGALDIGEGKRRSAGKGKCDYILAEFMDKTIL